MVGVVLCRAKGVVNDFGENLKRDVFSERIGWIWVVTVDGRKGNRTSIARQRHEALTFSPKL
jgi:hypothetical protein